MGKIIPSWTYKYDLDLNRKIYIELINKVFDSGRLLFGNELESFEKNFANYIGTTYAIGCDNATNAIFLILKSLKIGWGDEIITVANTAIPTVSAIRQANAKPVFVDVNNNALIDITKIEEKISPKTKAIIAVHLYGYACDVEEIKKITEKYNIALIEDCSQAHGSLFNNKKVGSFGDFSAFSFYPTKSLGAFGDAGIICTNSFKEFKLLKKLRFYGIENDYVAEIDGYNSRMDEIQAAILNFKLSNLDKNIEHRSKISEIYYKNIKNDLLYKIPMPIKSKSSFYLIPFYFSGDRNYFQDLLRNNGVLTNVSYKKPIHLMRAYEDLGYKKGYLPKTESFCDHNISLPICDLMPIDVAFEVVEKVNKVLKNF